MKRSQAAFSAHVALGSESEEEKMEEMDEGSDSGAAVKRGMSCGGSIIFGCFKNEKSVVVVPILPPAMCLVFALMQSENLFLNAFSAVEKLR